MKAIYINGGEVVYPASASFIRKRLNIAFTKMENLFRDFGNGFKGLYQVEETTYTPSNGFVGSVTESYEEYIPGKYRQKYIEVPTSNEEDLGEVKIALISQVDSLADMCRVKDLVIDGMRIRGDAHSFARLLGTANHSKSSRKVPLGNGESVEVNAAQLTNLRNAVDDYQQGINDRQVELYDLLNAATTLDEAKSVDLKSDWPSTEITT